MVAGAATIGGKRRAVGSTEVVVVAGNWCTRYMEITIGGTTEVVLLARRGSHKTDSLPHCCMTALKEQAAS